MKASDSSENRKIRRDFGSLHGVNLRKTRENGSQSNFPKSVLQKEKLREMLENSTRTTSVKAKNISFRVSAKKLSRTREKDRRYGLKIFGRKIKGEVIKKMFGNELSRRKVHRRIFETLQSFRREKSARRPNKYFKQIPSAPPHETKPVLPASRRKEVAALSALAVQQVRINQPDFFIPFKRKLRSAIPKFAAMKNCCGC